MDARIVSNQVINSLQISVLKEVPSGNFNPGVNFLLKNISDDDVEVTIIPAGQKDSIKTILGVGQNTLLVGGRAHYGSNAGLAYFFSANGSGAVAAHIGFRCLTLIS